jgi:hypothetical protein
MYACFKKIPKRLRQAAFDAIVKYGTFPYGNYAQTYCRTFVTGSDIPGDGWGIICCPLGMVNKVIVEQIDSRRDGPYVEGFLANFSLPSPSNETYFLDRTLGANVNEADVERFAERVDNKGFPTLASLASAMGVTYKAAQED